MPQECNDNVVQDLYMLVPTDKRTSALAGIPELLFWNLYLCAYHLLCASLRLLHLKMSSTCLIQRVYIVFQYSYCVY